VRRTRACRVLVAGGCVAVVGAGALLLATWSVEASGGSVSREADLPRPRWFTPSSGGVYHGFDGRMVWTDSTDPNAGLPVGK
jgi:hypothetical protein